MRKTLASIFSAAALLLVQTFAAPAQDKVQREKENIIIAAVQDMQSGQFGKAGDNLGALVKIDDSLDAAWYYLALCRLKEGKIDEAEAFLGRALEIDPDNFWYNIRLASIYSATDRTAQAIPIYEGLSRKYPDKTDLAYSLAEMYISEKRWDDALDALGQLEAEFGKSDAVELSRFDILLRQGKQQEAYDGLEAYNREYSSPQILSMLGDYNLSAYRDSVAIALYDEALDLAPGYPMAVLGKAEALRMTRKYEQYFPLMMEFVTNTDIPSAGKCDYLQSALKQLDSKFIRTFQPQMDSLVNAVCQTHPSDSSALNLSCFYYFATDRHGIALERIREEMETFPQSRSAAITCCQLLYSDNQLDSLAATALECFEKFPDAPEFLDFASYARYSQKDYPALIALQKRQLELAQKSGDQDKILQAICSLGDSMQQVGETKAAYKFYDKALKIDPGYVPVLNNYAYFLCVSGKKLKKAYEMSKKTIEAEPDNATYLDTFGWILHLLGKDIEAKPIFKHALLYGGKDSAVMLDHYAEVLYAIGEYDLAMVYWKQAAARNSLDEIPDLDERIRQRQESIRAAKNGGRK